MIILNKMYSGSYLNNNIGHEIINNYRADDGEQYIYINPKDATQELPNEENYVIQVRCVNSKCFEVLSCAKIEDDLYRNKLNKAVAITDSQTEIELIGADLEYGGQLLSKIFEDQPNDSIYAHFKVSNFKTCKEGVYLCTYDYAQEYSVENNNKYVVLNNFDFGKQNLRRYVYSTDNVYKDLLDFIKNLKFQYFEEVENKLIDKNLTKEGLPKDLETESIIDFVGKQKEELAFSNWIFKYLQYDKYHGRKMLKKFISFLISQNADNKYEIKDDELDNLDIQREYKNTDIWLETKNRIIIIENKIDSDITISKKDKENDVVDGNSKRSSQLSRYYEAVQENNTNQKKEYFFIFKPNSSNKVADLSIYKYGDKWSIVKYDKLYSFFSDFYTNADHKPPYMDEFLKALKPHIYNIATIVDLRFKLKIADIKEKIN